MRFVCTHGLYVLQEISAREKKGGVDRKIQKRMKCSRHSAVQSYDPMWNPTCGRLWDIVVSISPKLTHIFVRIIHTRFTVSHSYSYHPHNTIRLVVQCLSRRTGFSDIGREKGDFPTLQVLVPHQVDLMKFLKDFSIINYYCIISRDSSAPCLVGLIWFECFWLSYLPWDDARPVTLGCGHSACIATCDFFRVARGIPHIFMTIAYLWPFMIIAQNKNTSVQ